MISRNSSTVSWIAVDEQNTGSFHKTDRFLVCGQRGLLGVPSQSGPLFTLGKEHVYTTYPVNIDGACSLEIKDKGLLIIPQCNNHPPLIAATHRKLRHPVHLQCPRCLPVGGILQGGCDTETPGSFFPSMSTFLWCLSSLRWMYCFHKGGKGKYLLCSPCRSLWGVLWRVLREHISDSSFLSLLS